MVKYKPNHTSFSEKLFQNYIMKPLKSEKHACLTLQMKTSSSGLSNNETSSIISWIKRKRPASFCGVNPTAAKPRTAAQTRTVTFVGKCRRVTEPCRSLWHVKGGRCHTNMYPPKNPPLFLTYPLAERFRHPHAWKTWLFLHHYG